MILKFKNRKNYLNWLRYGHAKKIFERTPGNQKIIINGRAVKVKH